MRHGFGQPFEELKTERDSSRITLSVERERAPLHGKAGIGIAVGAVLDKHKTAKHFEINIGDTSLALCRKES